MSRTQLTRLHPSSSLSSPRRPLLTKEVVTTVTISLEGRWQGGKAAARWGSSDVSHILSAGNAIFPNMSLHPAIPTKVFRLPPGDDTWRMESTVSALAVLSHGFPGARRALMRRRRFSPWGNLWFPLTGSSVVPPTPLCRA